MSNMNFLIRNSKETRNEQDIRLSVVRNIIQDIESMMWNGEITVESSSKVIRMINQKHG